MVEESDSRQIRASCSRSFADLWLRLQHLVGFAAAHPRLSTSDSLSNTCLVPDLLAKPRGSNNIGEVGSMPVRANCTLAFDDVFDRLPNEL